MHKDQKGFTLLELIIGIALISLIITTVTMVIDQILSGSARSSNHMVAIRQVQEAGYWVSFYTYASQNTTITGVSGFPLILRWIDFDTSAEQRIEFTLTNPDPTSSIGILRGYYYVNSSLDSTLTGKIPAFGSINNATTNCQVSGGSVFSLPAQGAFTITCLNVSDNGRILVNNGTISVNTTGSAYCVNVTGGWTWNTTTAGGSITVTATSSGVRGSWTSETKAATAAITQGAGATLSSARGLVFTVTATVGEGRPAANETRIYKVVPKPVS